MFKLFFGASIFPVVIINFNHIPLQSFIVATSWTKQIQGDNTREELLSSESTSQSLTEDQGTTNSLTTKQIHSEEESNAQRSVVTDEEIARTIVGDDKEWKELQHQIRKAKVVTSLGVNQFCSTYFKEKAVEMQRLRDAKASEDKQTSPAPKNNIARLKKRLTLI